MEKMFAPLNSTQCQHCSPKTEDRQGVIAELDAKDFDPEDIRVNVHESTLTIEASHEKSEEGGSTSRSFKKVVTFPDSVHPDNIVCELTPNGVLRVTSSKVIQQPRYIPVIKAQQSFKSKDKHTLTDVPESTCCAHPLPRQRRHSHSDQTTSKSCKGMFQHHDSFGHPVFVYRPLERILNILMHDEHVFEAEQKVDTSSFLEKLDKHEVQINVKAFNPDEVNVKITDNKVVTVEATHDEKGERGHRYSQLVQRYQLPKNTKAEDVYASLTPDGLLTITAPKVVLKMLKSAPEPVETKSPEAKEMMEL